MRVLPLAKRVTGTPTVSECNHSRRKRVVSRDELDRIVHLSKINFRNDLAVVVTMTMNHVTASCII